MESFLDWGEDNRLKVEMYVYGITTTSKVQTQSLELHHTTGECNCSAAKRINRLIFFRERFFMINKELTASDLALYLWKS